MGNTSRRVRRGALPLLLLGTITCGDQGGADTPAALAPVVVSEAMLNLVPQDAVIVLQMPSVSVLDAALASFGAAIGASGSLSLTAFEELATTSWWNHYVDLHRPALTAWRPGVYGDELSAVSIYPTTDAAAASAALRDESIHIDGSYVASSPDANYVPGGSPSPLARDLPPGHISLRADVSALIAPVRPMLETVMTMAIAQSAASSAGPMDMAALMDAYFEMTLAALDGMITAEAGLRLDGGRLTLEGSVQVSEDSPLANLPSADCGSLEELVTYVDAGAAFQMVMAVDASAFADASHDIMLRTADAWPESTEDELYEYLATLRLMGKRCGHVFVSDGSFGESGMQASYLFGAGEGEDTQQFAEQLIGFMTSGVSFMGGNQVSTNAVEIDGLAATEIIVDISDMPIMPTGNATTDEAALKTFESLVGASGQMRYVAAATQGHVVVTATTGDVEGRLLREAGTVPEALAGALAYVDKEDTRIVFSIDYARMLRDMAPFFATLTPGADSPFDAIREEDTLPVTFALGGSGTTWRFAIVADLDDLGRISRR